MYEACVSCNSWGLNDYHRSCPLKYAHEYTIDVYALDTELDIPDDISIFEFRERIKYHIIDQATISGWIKTSDEFAIH